MSNRNGTFKKGDSRINRTGRPKKGKTLTDILIKHGNKRGRVEINGKTLSNKEALAFFLWEMALIDKNFSAIKYIYDRIDGLPTQAMNIDGNIKTKGIKPDKIIINNTDERMDRIIEILDSIKGIKKRGTKKGDNS